MVRTRFAPSPTGLLHIGNLRTALYAYAMAKHSQGQFILRIEDTDRDRYVPEGIDDIKKILTTFSLNWDEYYVQSERKAQGIYQLAAEKLISSGHAFYCQCAAKNAKEEGFSLLLRDPCRDKNYSSGAVKLKVPDNEKVSYYDFVLNKEISWDTDTVYDATLLKTDGFPTYHLAVAVDDTEMKITHLLRGHDWMPSTPIHLLVFKFLGGDIPEIGHLSDIQSPNGGKLSKRRDAVFVETFIDKGYLPEALLNFVTLLGWAPKDNREKFTLSEFVEMFDPHGFQKSNPLFQYNKLNWLNGEYIRAKTDTELSQLVKPYVKNNDIQFLIPQILPLVKDRLVKLTDFSDLAQCFIHAPQFDVSLFTEAEVSQTHLNFALDKLSPLEWNKETIDNALVPTVKANGWKVGDFFMSLRIAVCGSRSTPPLSDTMVVLGKTETLSRIKMALDKLDTAKLDSTIIKN